MLNQTGGVTGNLKSGCGGILFGSVFLGAGIAIVFVMIAISPKIPGYAKVMKKGESVPGEITEVVKDTSFSVNEEYPDRITYTWGDDGSASLMIAMKETATVGQAVTVRTLDDLAYPEGIKPMTFPWWIYIFPGIFIVVGLCIIVGCIVHLLLVGFVLAKGGA